MQIHARRAVLVAILVFLVLFAFRIGFAPRPAGVRVGRLDASPGAALLEDLTAKGPFAPIFRQTSNPAQPVDWLGKER